MFGSVWGRPSLFQLYEYFRQFTAELLHQRLAALHGKADTCGGKAESSGQVSLGQTQLPHSPVAKQAPRLYLAAVPSGACRALRAIIFAYW